MSEDPKDPKDPKLPTIYDMYNDLGGDQPGHMNLADPSKAEEYEEWLGDAAIKIEIIPQGGEQHHMKAVYRQPTTVAEADEMIRIMGVIHDLVIRFGLKVQETMAALKYSDPDELMKILENAEIKGKAH